MCFSRSNCFLLTSLTFPRRLKTRTTSALSAQNPSQRNEITLVLNEEIKPQRWKPISSSSRPVINLVLPSDPECEPINTEQFSRVYSPFSSCAAEFGSLGFAFATSIKKQIVTIMTDELSNERREERSENVCRRCAINVTVVATGVIKVLFICIFPAVNEMFECHLVRGEKCPTVNFKQRMR